VAHPASAEADGGGTNVRRPSVFFLPLLGGHHSILRTGGEVTAAAHIEVGEREPAEIAAGRWQDGEEEALLSGKV
jgi:hypothetical protein